MNLVQFPFQYFIHNEIGATRRWWEGINWSANGKVEYEEEEQLVRIFEEVKNNSLNWHTGGRGGPSLLGETWI